MSSLCLAEVRLLERRFADYREQSVLGMRAFSRVYAGWGLSQPFYKRELWRQMGFDSLADFLTGFWEKRYGRRDANNLLSMDVGVERFGCDAGTGWKPRACPRGYQGQGHDHGRSDRLVLH